MMASTILDQKPIFISGLAHSGKTPLRMVLSSHPNIALSRRTFMWDRYEGRYGNLDRSENFERCLNALLADPDIAALHPDSARIRSEFHQGWRTYARLFSLFHQHFAERSGKRRWGIQMGNAEYYADKLMAAYPGAKIIHMMRDPQETCEIILAISGNRPGKVGWNAARWLSSAQVAQRNLDRYPDGYKVIRYETLLAEPEETIREICVFLQEPFTPEMAGILVNWNRGDLQGRSGSSFERGRQTDREKLRQPMSVQALVFTQAAMRPRLNRFGYHLQQPILSPVERLRYFLVDWPVNRAGMAAWQNLKAPSLHKILQEI